MIGLLNPRDGAFVDMIQPANPLHPRNRGLTARWLVLPGLMGGARFVDIMNPGPNGNHGTLTNMDPVTDWVPSSRPGGFGALDFGAGDDFVNLGQLGDLIGGVEDDFSLSFWIKTTAATNGLHIPIGIINGDTIWQIAIERNATNKVEIFLRDIGLQRIWVSSSQAVNDGVWHHISCTKSGNTASDLAIYIDGVFQSVTIRSDQAPFDSGDEAIDLYLGARNNGGVDDNHLDGTLDDIEIWNRFLSTAEVQANYLDSRAGYYPELNWVQNRVRSSAVPSIAAAAGAFNFLPNQLPTSVTDY